MAWPCSAICRYVTGDHPHGLLVACNPCKLLTLYWQTIPSVIRLTDVSAVLLVLFSTWLVPASVSEEERKDLSWFPPDRHGLASLFCSLSCSSLSSPWSTGS